jgi:hypothetical protein
LVERFNTLSQAKFYIEHAGGDFAPYLKEHQVYHSALGLLTQSLGRLVKTHVIERSFLPNYIFTPADLVVTIGIDGLVVNTAKYLNGQPIVAVNPDPASIDGVLLPFNVGSATQAAAGLIKEGRSPHCHEITMAEVVLKDGQTLLAVNDFFVGVENHTSARYQIRFGGQVENHSSSGIIISTGVGATGWLSSIFAMTNGLLTTLGATPPLPPPNLGWEDEKLFFVVREPFVSKTSGANVVCGFITPDQPLHLESQTPLGGVIFSDGVPTDALQFNAGAAATFQIAARKTRLVRL